MTSRTGPGPLLARFDRLQRRLNGVPDENAGRDRRRCQAVLQEVLGDLVGASGIRASPLGVDWTEVFDVDLPAGTDPAPLLARGWLPLDPLLGLSASRGRPARWAVVEDGRVLAGIRLVEGPVDEVSTVLDRCRERSEVRLCDVLELCLLRERGLRFPVDDAVLRVASDIESALDGRVLAPWASGRSLVPPVALPGGRRTAVVAVSGVDGSGKSTFRAALTAALSAAGVPVTTVWVRPGMGLGRLNALAAWGKRILRQDPAPALRAMATPAAERPASRRGPVGWVWALLVTLSFLAGVRRRHAAASGVVVYDRHLVDALATLDFAYAGVDLRLPHRLLLTLLPAADVRLYLDVPPEVSIDRKPDDLLGEHAVRSQLARYAYWLDRLPPATRLDGTRPTAQLVLSALPEIVAATKSVPPAP